MRRDESIRDLSRLVTAPEDVDRLREFGLQVAIRGWLTGDFVTESDWRRLDSVCHIEMGQSPPSEHYNRDRVGLPFFQGKADFGKVSPTARYWCTKPTKIAEEGDVLISVRAPVGPTNVADQRCCIGRGLAALRPSALLTLDYLLLTLRATEDLLASLGYGTTFAAITKKQLGAHLIPVPSVEAQNRIVQAGHELMELCDDLADAGHRRDETRDRLRVASLARLTAPTGTPGKAPQEDVAFFLSRSDRMVTKPGHLGDLRRTILDLAIRGSLTTGRANDSDAAHALKLLAQRRAEKVRQKEVRKPHPVPPVTEATGLFSLRSGWAWCRLGQLCYQVADGPHFSPQYVPRTNGVPFLSTRNVRMDGFDLSDLKYVSRSDHEVFCRRVRPTQGDILYTKGGTTGIARVNDLDFEFSVWVHLAVLRIDQGLVNPYYVALALNSQWCYAQSQVYTQGISNFDLGLTRMIKITLPLPPLQEQQRIVAKVDELMTVCDELEQALRRAEEGRAKLLGAVLHEALNGRVPDAELAEATA